MKYRIVSLLGILPLLLGQLSVAYAAEGEYEPVQLLPREAAPMRAVHELEDHFLRRGDRVRDQYLENWLNEIGRKLHPPSVDEYIDYRFYVLRDPLPYAFGLPDGQIYIHTGMLALLENEAQLAGVLAHEIQHVAGHHGILAFRSERKKAIVKLAVTSAAGLGLLGDLGDLVSSGTNQYLLYSILGYRKRLEEEADRLAVAQVFDAGYDVRELPRIFQILARNPEGETPAFVTKWNDPNQLNERRSRTQRVADYLFDRSEEMNPIVGRGDYLPMARSPGLMTVRDNIDRDYSRTAVELARQLDHTYPDDPEVLVALGDSLRALGPRSELSDQERSDPKIHLENAQMRKKLTSAERQEQFLKSLKGWENFEKNVSEAVEIYQLARDLDDQNSEIFRGLGQANQDLDRHREAGNAFRNYLRLEPESSDRSDVIKRLRRIVEELKKERGGQDEEKKPKD